MPRKTFLVDWDNSLGAGGEGEVYLGRAADTGELCAVKVSTLIDPAAAREQLEQELVRCRRAAGAGAVGLIAWNLEAARPFLIFELAHAGTLADEMEEVRNRGSVYHPVHALERIRQVLSALSAVHERGLIHRDVKPANLLRFGDGIKLTDFGTGRTLQRPQALQTESFVGTRMYAAPEQRSGGAVDQRADLYAAGCILCEMLTGALPEADRPVESISTYATVLVLPELDRLLSSLLSADPEARPADAPEAIRRVDAILEAYAEVRRVWEQLLPGPSPY